MTAKLQLSNPRDTTIAPIEVPALADTGAVFEDMDLVVDPRGRTVDVNPASPNIASGIVKRAA